MKVAVKRVYEEAAASDGARVLVDRLWPRGVGRETAALTEWLRDLAPSHGLRQWFHAQPGRWIEFRRRYLAELRAADAALTQLYALGTKHRRLTLLYASRDIEHNHAHVLKDLIEGMKKPPSSTGPVALRQRAVRKG
jgi:uncharacterized protein YeaO (DUF488 family)